MAILATSQAFHRKLLAGESKSNYLKKKEYSICQHEVMAPCETAILRGCVTAGATARHDGEPTGSQARRAACHDAAFPAGCRKRRQSGQHSPGTIRLTGKQNGMGADC